MTAQRINPKVLKWIPLLFAFVACRNATQALTQLAEKLGIKAQPITAVSGVGLTPAPLVQLQTVAGVDVAQGGVSVTAKVASGNGTLSGTTTATTDAKGTASFPNLILTGDGTQALQFAAFEFASDASLPITVASKLAIAAQPTTTVSGAALAPAPVVRLQTSAGSGVSHGSVPVTATLGAGDGALSGTTTAMTDGTGAARFTNLVLSGGSASTIQFATGTLSSVTTAPITFQSGAACGSSGGGATITSISREAGSTAGGLLVQISGSGFQPADCIRFGAVNATGVTLLTSTVLQAVVPAGAAGTVDVSVTQNGTTSTLPKAFTYVPAATTTIATADFEAGTLSPYTTATGASVTTLQARSGTRAVLHRFSASATQNSLSFNLGNNNYPVTSANGLWMRWFFYVPAATVNALSSGQIKLHFARIFNSGGAPIGGWLELGIGPEISTAANQLRAVVDQTPSNPPLGANFPYAANTWYEVVLHYQRNTSTSMGTAQMWIGTGGTLKYQGSVTHAALGTNGATDNSGFNLGIYSQNASAYPIDVFSDDVTIANGWIGP